MGELRDQDLGSWMNGLVEQFDCDAFLCPLNCMPRWGGRRRKGVLVMSVLGGTRGFMCVQECDSDVMAASKFEILVEFYLVCLGPQ